MYNNSDESIEVFSSILHTTINNNVKARWFKLMNFNFNIIIINLGLTINIWHPRVQITVAIFIILVTNNQSSIFTLPHFSLQYDFLCTFWCPWFFEFLRFLCAFSRWLFKQDSCVWQTTSPVTVWPYYERVKRLLPDNIYFVWLLFNILSIKNT